MVQIFEKHQERSKEREEIVEGRREQYEWVVQRGPDGWEGKCSGSFPGAQVNNQPDSHL